MFIFVLDKHRFGIQHKIKFKFWFTAGSRYPFACLVSMLPSLLIHLLFLLLLLLLHF